MSYLKVGQRPILIFPCIRVFNLKKLGSITIKSTNQDFKKETRGNKKELLRIINFFRQAEGRDLDSFSYAFLNRRSNLEEVLNSIRKDLELYRFLNFYPNRRSLFYEHTVPYLIIPYPNNPHIFKDKKKVYMYSSFENFGTQDRHLNFYEDIPTKPPFNLNVSADSSTFIDEEKFKKLKRKAKEKDIRALSWYNKVYSNKAVDQLENLLRLSTAFECLFEVSKTSGVNLSLKNLIKDVKPIGKLTDAQIKVLKNYLTSKVTSQLSLKILNLTKSDAIKKWFQKDFYDTGSSIRHGDDVLLLPNGKPSKNAKSIWYRGKASQDFLNNVSFGKRLFKFIFLEKLDPSTEFYRLFEVQLLEQELISDEERLKILEDNIMNKKPGTLSSADLEICTALGTNYSGEKLKIYQLLQRILSELKISFHPDWKKFSKEGNLIIKNNLTSEQIQDFSTFDKFYSALIEIDRNVDLLNMSYMKPDHEKLFLLREYISYSLNRLVG